LRKKKSNIREKVVIGYRGEIGSAIYKIFKAEYGIDYYEGKLTIPRFWWHPTDDFKIPHIDSDNGYVDINDLPQDLIMHVCIPYTKEFNETVMKYNQILKPSMIIVHSTVPPEELEELAYDMGHSTPVIHCPINGKHPNIEADIRKYTMFVGPVTTEKDGQMACEYLEYYGLRTYLCTTALGTALAKLMSTEFLRVQIEFFRKYKKICEDFFINWAEIIEFFKAIGFKTFQRAGPIDTEMSGKHCLNNNERILKEWLDHYETT